MRARYSAYFFGRIDYLVDTTHPDKKTPQTRAGIVALADEARWKFLTILNTSKGQADDKTGKVGICGAILPRRGAAGAP